MHLASLYSNVARGNSEERLFAEEIWGPIPRELSQVSNLAKSNKKRFNYLKDVEESLELLRKILRTHHRYLRNLTPELDAHLENLDAGLIEVAHQPLLFGGQAFLISKLFLTHRLADAARAESDDPSFVPIFYIGDHDTVQNELITTRFPMSISQDGLYIKSEISSRFDQSAIHAVPMPSHKWIRKSIDMILDNARSLLRSSGVRGRTRELLEERLRSAVDLIETQAYTLNSLADWSTHILTRIMSGNRMAIPMIRASDNELRKLIVGGFERLLQEETRQKFIRTMNEYRDRIIKNGFNAGLPPREKSYVPFFYECDCELRVRVNLEAFIEGAYVNLTGNCPKCGESYHFSFSAQNPDLSDIAENISPRVDSRALALAEVLPIVAHVGGGGETAYYGQVAPAMRAVGVQPPIFVRYNRVLYNSPWSESLARNLLEDEGCRVCPVQTHALWGALRDLRKTKRSAHRREIAYDIEQMLTESNEGITKIVEETEEALRTKSRKIPRIEMKRLIKQRLYISFTYGRLSQEARPQDVIWHWLDLGMIVGTYDLAGFFNRHTWLDLPPGTTIFGNTGSFLEN